MNLKDLSISNDLVLLMLIRIIPGSENSLYGEIQNFEKVHKCKLNVFKGFGRYDVIIIIETEKLQILDTFRNNIIVHIFEFYPLILFRWNSEKNKNIRIDFTKKFCGISIIKLNQPSKLGIQEEINLIKSFIKLDDILICGGIGYHEVIIIFTEDTLTDFENKMKSIEEIIAESNTQCINKSTIPAFNYDWIFNNESIRASSENSNEQIDFISLISINAGFFNNNLIKELTKNDVNLISIFGHHDFIIEKSEDIHNYLDQLLNLRNSLSAQNYFPTSFTLIKRVGDMGIEIDKSRGKNLLRSPISIDKNQESETKYLIHIYNQLIQNPHTQNLFLNKLDDFFLTFLPNLKEAKEKFIDEGLIFRSRNKVIEYNMLIKVVIYTFIQRLSGVFIGDLLSSHLLNFENYGSVNRLIYALESFPIYFFNISEGDFDGFCCIGFDDRYCGYSGNIYNIPRSKLFKIEEWWGILHEIFHNLEIQIRSEEKINFLGIHPDLEEEFNTTINALILARYEDFKKRIQDIMSIKDNVMKKKKVDIKLLKPWFMSYHGHHDMNFIYETIPSVLDFYLGWCPDKRELHYLKLGRYLAKEFSLASDEYYLARFSFLRLFELILYREEFEEKGVDFTFEGIEQELYEFFNNLEKVLEIKINKKIKTRAISISLFYQSLASFYVNWFKRIDCVRFNMENKKRLKKSIKDGFIDLSFEYIPLEVLHALFEIEEEGVLNNTTRITSFLYLYHYRIQQAFKKQNENQ